MEILRAENLTKCYGKGETEVVALDHVNLSVEKGEFVAIVGASGSGKSTLLHLLGGVDRPTEGRVLIDGKDIFALNDDKLAIFRRRQVGLVYQFYNLIPILNVEENIALPLELDAREVDPERMEELLKLLGLTERRKHLPNELSGGQQQRTSIGRALIPNPTIILELNEDWDALTNADWQRYYDMIERVTDLYEVHTYLISMEAGLFRDHSTRFLGAVMLIVVIIVVLTSVFCIRNSFAISITEKTRLYGMLASVGATKKQIRKNVFFEAAILGMIGIPLGLVSGLFACYVLMHISNSMIAGSLSDGMVLHFSFSWIALAAAVLLGILTIYLSAVSSARRASKVSPITAIRDSGAVKSNAKKLRTPWLVKRLFGVGGVIAHKNIRRNRRKYRTTVLSIIVSVAVFVALSSFMALTNDTLKFEFQSEGWNLCYLCFTVALRCKMTVISRCCDVSALTGDGRMYMEHNEHLKRTIWASVLTTVLTLVCVGAALHAGAPLFVVLVLNLLGFGVVIGLFLAYNRWKNRELVKITHLIEEINRRNYALDIDNISEEELSILKNEIYKTTLFLKSQAENSLKDKETLKEALSDISHQLKTPLTSCLVMLDNMLDDPEMEPAVREDFIRGVKRELGSVNFLVQSILKLSRFDVNAVTFHREPMSLAELVEEAVKNVSLLCDLKDVRLDIKQDSEPCGDSNRLICDRRWEIEAITNILKNAVEHSPAGEVVEIAYEQNRAYARLSIRDYGEGITGEEETHIFERYYRGRHAGEDSVGIGLALARTIIGQDGGQVYAERMERGMRFQIRWVYSFQDGNEE